MELPKAYDPKAVEEKIYRLWEESGFFNPDNAPKKGGKKKPFSIVMPLPNITGTLHIGHALNAITSDVLIRWHRMRGESTVWLPGLDHAGIATQNAVEKELRKEGKTRFDLGRDPFVARVWEWKKKYGEIILEQLRKIGASCDWSRTRFTMDPAYSDAVAQAFIHYYNKGLLYRAQRTILWCPRCKTSISDLELGHIEESAPLYYIRYGPLTIATARPETKFGDTAVAVHPKDARYKKYIGKEIKIESLDIRGSRDAPAKTIVIMKVVGDTAVDPKFGTGAIKVTPAHDTTDWEIAQRHQMSFVQVIDENGRMNDRSGKYAGMKVAEARKKIVEDLKITGLLVREEPSQHRIAVCSRCNATIEPLPSWQWFLRMQRMAVLAASAVHSGKIKIIPKNFEKIYFAWLANIRDWCVSRQLWWGHRLPAWFHEQKCTPIAGREKEVGQCEEIKVSVTKPKCLYCDSNYIQSEDVLDTWFSSALWPFAALPEKDLGRFYPSSVLVTARDIINLWVGRMIFSGFEFIKKKPFAEVFIHATVLTKEGKRMSKSLGTGIDPLLLIEQQGADAMRFGILWQTMGTQDIHWDEAAVVTGKKFANKLWNAARFVLQQTGTFHGQSLISHMKPRATASENKKILTQLKKTKIAVEKHLQKYQFGQALRTLYDFFWHDYCDVYLEWSKQNQSQETKTVLGHALRESLKLLHPFMPFITEEIWQKAGGELLMVEMLYTKE